MSLMIVVCTHNAAVTTLVAHLTAKQKARMRYKEVRLKYKLIAVSFDIVTDRNMY